MGRVVQRACEIMREHKTDDVRQARRHRPADDPEVPQLPLLGVARPLRLRDLHQRRELLHGRPQGPVRGDEEGRRPPAEERDVSGRRRSTATASSPARSRRCPPLNERLRDDYVADCERGVRRWNQVITKHGIDAELTLPHRGFHRAIGAFAGRPRLPDGRVVSQAEWDAHRRRVAAHAPRTRRTWRAS